MNKAELRKNAKKLRGELDIPAISQIICSRISQLSEFKHARNVLLYYPKGNELNLLELCTLGKKFYLPRVKGENLLICPYDCNVKLECSAFNILEPDSMPVEHEKIDFAIIPCLMADENKFRLGYGGGFYDRFIPQLRPDCVKLCAVPDELFVKSLPTEAHDIAMDIVITETLIKT